MHAAGGLSLGEGAGGTGAGGVLAPDAADGSPGPEGGSQAAGGLFAGFRFHRLTEVPTGEDDDRTSAALISALTAAHAELSGVPGAGLAVVWQRTAPGAPVALLVGGRPYFPPAGPDAWSAGATGPVLYPPGSRGLALDTGPLADAWQAVPAWIACTGRADPLWAADNPAGRTLRRGTFADSVAHLTGPFVWLVLAEPAPREAVTAELAELSRHIPVLRQRENSASDRVALDRAQARYRELSRAEAAGTWRVRIAAGGPDPASARRTAAVLCAAAELADLPYLLVPAPGPVPFGGLPTSGSPAAADAPLHATADLLAALTRPPERELPGLRAVERARFDVTPESGGELPLGVVLDDAGRPSGGFSVRTSTLNRHAFVAGATGAGKSQTVRHLLEGLHRAGIPWLVIEPAKAEYARMAGRIGAEHVAVIRPGAPDAVPLSLNPLEPEPGFPLSTHIELVQALFLAAFAATEPFPQVLAGALARCYAELGWEQVLSASRFPHAVPRYPTLTDLHRTALEVVEGIGYGREVTDNVRGFVDVRIGSLRLGAPGRFFTGGHPLDLADLLRRNVVLEIEDIGNDQNTAFLIGAILIRLHEHLRVHRDTREGGLRHVTVLEEAHRLLRHVDPATPAALAIELFTTLLAEIRAYGEGIVVAEQIPAKIVSDVIKNTALKIVHRLPAADDRAVVGATMNLDEPQSRQVVSLAPGSAAVFTDGMDRPLRIRVPLGEHLEGGATAAGQVAATGPARAACPARCAAEPCTLRQITRAAAHAEQDPEPALWIELLTVAHVLGHPEPQPEPSWLARHAASADRRLLECAAGQLAQDAVNRRYRALIEHYQPEDLARHVAARVLDHLTGDPGDGCDGTEVRWQAGLFRWRDVFAAFAARDYDPDLPHPLTEQWRARGLDLEQAPARKQLVDLHRQHASRTTDRTAIDGAGEPPAHQRLAALLSRPGPPMHRFMEATRFLTFSSAWPLHRLYPSEWAAAQDADQHRPPAAPGKQPPDER